MLKNNIKTKKIKKICLDTLITIGAFAICTGISFLLDHFGINDLNFLIIYILGILLTAVFTSGYVYSSILSVISVFGYNFFFTHPRFTFKINDSEYLVTFFLMFAIGIVISTVTFLLKKKMAQISKLTIEKIEFKNNAEKEQLKATLLRSISHDLRTPLTTMKNGAEILIDNPNIDEADKHEILNDIISKANWTVRLVENLLSLTRIDSEKLTVKKEPEALEEILPQAIRNVSGIICDRQIHYELPANMLLVPMDATLIIQTIGNIINNAVRHTEPNGNIWIKVWNSGKNAIFRISNDGLPIRDDDLPHIFDMYYTTADTNNEGGIGLGLSICKLIIRAHGGQISARNNDNRVIFEFSLPMEE